MVDESLHWTNRIFSRLRRVYGMHNSLLLAAAVLPLKKSIRFFGSIDTLFFPLFILRFYCAGRGPRRDPRLIFVKHPSSFPFFPRTLPFCGIHAVRRPILPGLSFFSIDVFFFEHFPRIQYFNRILLFTPAETFCCGQFYTRGPSRRRPPPFLLFFFTPFAFFPSPPPTEPPPVRRKLMWHTFRVKISRFAVTLSELLAFFSLSSFPFLPFTIFRKVGFDKFSFLTQTLFFRVFPSRSFPRAGYHSFVVFVMAGAPSGILTD